jgi:hypothetical protein
MQDVFHRCDPGAVGPAGLRNTEDLPESARHDAISVLQAGAVRGIVVATLRCTIDKMGGEVVAMRRWRDACRQALILCALASAAASGRAQGPSPSTGPLEMLPRAPEGQSWELPGSNYAPGSAWLALLCASGGCQLRPVTLETQPVTKHPYDGDPIPGQRLVWRGLDVVRQVPLLTLKAAPGMPWLTPRPVPTFYRGGEPIPRATGRGTMESRIDLGGGEHALLVPRLVKGKANAGGDAEGRMDLQLRVGKARQVLGQFGFDILGLRPVPPEEYLLWAGDLDADGKPDFLISFGMGSYDIGLFLSSLAKPGELVGEAGRFTYFPVEDSGC